MFDWTSSCKLRGRDLSFFCALIEESSTVVPTVNTSTIIHGGDRRATLQKHHLHFQRKNPAASFDSRGALVFCSSSKMISF